ncbi:MAG: hypothetical protein WCQ95_05315 [Bacteroidota bacterium]
MSKIVSINVKCPMCGKSLMDSENFLHGKPSIKLNIQLGNTRGTIRLCSIYGCFDHQADMDISGVDIAEFSCPHCNQVLHGKEICSECQAPMVPLTMDIGGKVEFCSRKGCSKHYVAFEDLYGTLNKFYDEYGF